jgi:HlyD family secretion protein
MRRGWIAVAILGSLSLLLWLGSRSPQGTLEVDVAEVERGALADTAMASGNLVYAEQIQLRPEVGGRVAEVLVEEGEQVRRGQLLMRLDPESFEAELAAAEAGVIASEIEIRSRKARVADLARQLERKQVLSSRGLIDRDAFEQLQSQHELAGIAVLAAEQSRVQAMAQADGARNRLQRSRFLAPIDGLMISVDIKPGETVVPGTLNAIGSDLMVLADPSVLLAELRVDEADIARVRLGQRVDVYAASHPQTALQASVVHIAASARPGGVSQSLSFRVRAQISDTRLALHPGMSVRAEIETDSGSEGLHVPVAAIRSDAQGSHVWTVTQDNLARRVPVEPGMANDFAQQVSGALELRERVITGPGRVLAQIRDGAPVRIREPGA